MNRSLLNILLIDRDEARRSELEAKLKTLYRVTSFSSAHSFLSCSERIDAYDLALIHARDAEQSDGELEMACYDASTPVVIYSGGIRDAEKRSGKVIEVSDRDLRSFCLDGIRFLTEFGTLDPTAWSLGFTPAKKAAVADLCLELRRPFLFGQPSADEVLTAESSRVTLLALGRICSDRSGIVLLECIQQAILEKRWEDMGRFLDRLIEQIR